MCCQRVFFYCFQPFKTVYKELMPFAATSMDLEITMLSEESLKEKDDITASYVAFTGAAGVSTLLSSLGYDEKSWFPLGPF